MPKPPVNIIKSKGQTPTEESLSQLCDRTFLRLWAYANPFKSDGKELCDLIAVFENHVFLFFDRESKTFDTSTKDVELIWKRWKKEVIDKQVGTANGANKYVLQYPNEIYLDAKCTIPFPIKLPSTDILIHKIVVAHGAKDACKRYSPANQSGSLGISYSDYGIGTPTPFLVNLSRSDSIHLFDTHNLAIILEELDTFYDFKSYLLAKEAAISRYNLIAYCGEEDLLAHYYGNFDQVSDTHFIGTKEKNINAVMIGEGEWNDFSKSEAYRRKKEADKISYVWDQLLQRTSQNALDGTLVGNADVYNSRSAIFEMAKEPRFWRRALAEQIKDAIARFPYHLTGIARHLSFMPSFYPDKGYVFLQLRYPAILDDDYDSVYRPKRQAMLELACGVAKNKFDHLQKIIGMAIDAPKDRQINSEDFILIECETWSEEQRNFYKAGNKDLKFFESPDLQKRQKRVSNFPQVGATSAKIKISRNEKCPCGSGKKYKKCHG